MTISPTIAGPRRHMVVAICLWLLSSLVPHAGIAAAEAATCFGNCETYLASAMCGCDYNCNHFGDCCPDYPQYCTACGDGRLDQGEACDLGPDNGTTESCCSADCTLRSGGTCENLPSHPVCTAGTCQAGECVASLVPAGTGCHVSACESGTCNATGQCVAADLPAGTDCGVPGCSAGACDGAGQCLVTDLPTALDCDGDTTPDCFDGCPKDPAKTEPGACGCGIPEGTCPVAGHCSRRTCNGYVASPAIPNPCYEKYGNLPQCRAPDGCYCDAACSTWEDCCPGFDYAQTCRDVCGDDHCGSSEDASSCPTDCGSCSAPASTTTTTTPPTTTTTIPVDVPVTKSKLTILDMVAESGKAKITYVANGPAAAKGTTGDATRISARLQYQIAAIGAWGEAAMPQGPGWIANSAKVAKYVNRNAPTDGAVQAAIVKPGKALKVVLKDLGDPGSRIDVYQGGALTTPVDVAIQFTVVDGGETIQRCGTFTGCVRSLIAGGKGAKVVCKSVAPAPSGCP